MEIRRSFAGWFSDHWGGNPFYRAGPEGKTSSATDRPGRKANLDDRERDQMGYRKGNFSSRHFCVRNGVCDNVETN